jgi:uncharacterized membrane protein
MTIYERLADIGVVLTVVGLGTIFIATRESFNFIGETVVSIAGWLAAIGIVLTLLTVIVAALSPAQKHPDA